MLTALKLNVYEIYFRKIHMKDGALLIKDARRNRKYNHNFIIFYLLFRESVEGKTICSYYRDVVERILWKIRQCFFLCFSSFIKNGSSEKIRASRFINDRVERFSILSNVILGRSFIYLFNQFLCSHDAEGWTLDKHFQYSIFRKTVH